MSPLESDGRRDVPRHIRAGRLPLRAYCPSCRFRYLLAWRARETQSSRDPSSSRRRRSPACARHVDTANCGWLLPRAVCHHPRPLFPKSAGGAREFFLLRFDGQAKNAWRSLARASSGCSWPAYCGGFDFALMWWAICTGVFWWSSQAVKAACLKKWMEQLAVHCNWEGICKCVSAHCTPTCQKVW